MNLISGNCAGHSFLLKSICPKFKAGVYILMIISGYPWPGSCSSLAFFVNQIEGFVLEMAT